MVSPCESFISSSSKLSCSPTVNAFDHALHQCVKNFKELLSEYEQVLTELDSCKDELSKQKALCESQKCSGSEALQKVLVTKEKCIDTKDNIINSVASTMTLLNETRNWSLIDTIFTIICQGTATLSPSKQEKQTDNIPENNKLKITPLKLSYDTKKAIKREKLTPIIESFQKTGKKTPAEDQNRSTSPIEDVSFKDESISEIDVTPRAKSPILNGRNRRNNSVMMKDSLLSNSPCDNNAREKKKCPPSWASSPAKQHISNIAFPKKKSKPSKSDKGADKKLTQLRFGKDSFARSPSVVDLTSSPECSGETRDGFLVTVKKLIKKESSENDETILPSPTSNSTPQFISKTLKEKEILSKLKRPLSLKHKTEPTDFKENHFINKNFQDSKINTMTCNIQQVSSEMIYLIGPENSKVSPKDSDVPMDSKVREMNSSKVREMNSKVRGMGSEVQLLIENSPVVSFVEPKVILKVQDMEESINLIFPNRHKIPATSQSTLDQLHPDITEAMDYDVTKCDTLLPLCDVDEQASKENVHADNKASMVISFVSPTKRPLVENKNVSNSRADCSMSLLGGGIKGTEQTIKRKTPEKVEPVYKQPTIRKKADKMALPAWLCEDCKNFIAALYDNPDPEQIESIIRKCGKHRGQNNPARPHTPPGYWEPRWSVPTDTDLFNRANGV